MDATEKVIRCAGIRPEDATPEIRALASQALKDCYYIDLATERLLEMLRVKIKHGLR